MKAYFFGCKDEPGHYLFDAQFRSARRSETPWSTLDGVLCPTGAQHEGRARLHHKDGWTALAFWDRTGDSRLNSNSVFIVDTNLAFDEMVTAAAQAFPKIWSRFHFPIHPFCGDCRESGVRGGDGADIFQCPCRHSV